VPSPTFLVVHGRRRTALARGRVRPTGQLCNMDPAIDSVQPGTGCLDFACPAFPGSRSTLSVPTPLVEIGLSSRNQSATVGQHPSRRNSARRHRPSMEVFWLAPIVEFCKTTGAARATARSSVWFYPSTMPAVPAPAAASVVPLARRGNCCRGRREQSAVSEDGVPCNGREEFPATGERSSLRERG
jgi:hypothetical protein